MIGRAFRIVVACLVAVMIAAGFGWSYVWWFGLPADVLTLFVFAAGLAFVLFLAGHLFGVRSHAYYLVISGLVFLGVDVLMWSRFDIMPGPKFFQDGFVPAAIMGLFLGLFYRIIAIADSAMRERH